MLVLTIWHWTLSIYFNDKICICLFSATTSVETVNEEAIDEKTESPESQSTEYAYNHKGQLVVNGYPFIRSAIKGAVNTSIEWRCADGRKFKCNARVRTLSKTLQIINANHNHEARKQRQFNDIPIWNENENAENA